MDFEHFDPACLDEIEHVFPSLGNVVTVKNAGYYLSLLDQFIHLRDMFQDHLDVFHARAEIRYTQWVHGCKHKPSNVTHLVPPLDVAYMYHVHLLSPYRFYEDTQRMMIPHMMFIPLPLEQLHVQRNAPNESSVAFWREKCGDGDEPFKLTVEDLYKPLPSFRNCPYCKKGYKINSADYGKWRVDANTLLRCWCCDKDFNVHDASVAQILEDLAHSPIPKTETDQLAWLRGTLLNNTGNVRRVLTEDRPANAVAGMLLRFHRHEEKVIPGSLAFSEFILTSVSGKTKSMYEIEAILVKQLHFRALDQGWKKPEEKAKREKLLDFTSCINACYSNNPSPFSLNLIQAAEKQYRESIRLLSIPWVYPDTVIRGIRHYKAFLSLFAQRDHELRQLPPTQTELVWRLHMMFPMQYRDLTLKCTGRVVNHEDNIRNVLVCKSTAPYSWTMSMVLHLLTTPLMMMMMMMMMPWKPALVPLSIPIPAPATRAIDAVAIDPQQAITNIATPRHLITLQPNPHPLPLRFILTDKLLLSHADNESKWWLHRFLKSMELL